MLVNKFVYSLLVFSLNFYHSSAFRCYICAANEVDMRCVEDVETVAIKYECDKKYCTSYRIELLEPKGKVVTMMRSCEDKPLYLNEVFEDNMFRYYSVACQEDLCNGGTGKGSGSSSLKDKERTGVLYVPGTSKTNGAGNMKTSLLFAISIIFVYF